MRALHRLSCSALAFASVLGTGCGLMTYGSTLYPDEQRSRPSLKHLGERRVVIVFQDDAVPLVSEVDVAGGTFRLRHVRPVIEQRLKSSLRGSVRSVDVAFGESPPGYDLYLVPAVKLSGSGQLSKRCTADVTVKVKDAAGADLAEKHEQLGFDFVVMFSGPGLCGDAIVGGLASASTVALQQVDEGARSQSPARTPAPAAAKSVATGEKRRRR